MASFDLPKNLPSTTIPANRTQQVNACIANYDQMLTEDKIGLLITEDLQEIIIITPSNDNIADAVPYLSLIHI